MLKSINKILINKLINLILPLNKYLQFRQQYNRYYFN